MEIKRQTMFVDSPPPTNPPSILVEVGLFGGLYLYAFIIFPRYKKKLTFFNFA